MAKQKAPTARRTPVLRLKVSGRDIRPGRIPVPDLLVICEHAQSAVDRQAEALEGQSTLRPGPTTERVRHECTLELVSLGKGSAVLGFDQAKPERNLPPMGNLGVDAVAGVARVIASLSRGENIHVDPGVLQSLHKLGALLTNGVDEVEWTVPPQHGHKRIKASFTRAVHRRVASRLRPPTTGDYSGDGVLQMADFKPSEHKCRLLPPVGPPINCTFDAALADEVYDALRQAAHVEGKATVNAETGRTEAVHIKSVRPLDPLAVNAGNFVRGWSFDQLVHTQAVTPLRDPKSLAGGWPADDDLDAALREIYDHRA